MDCRVCTLIVGKRVAHDSERLHKDAPAYDISKAVGQYLEKKESD